MLRVANIDWVPREGRREGGREGLCVSVCLSASLSVGVLSLFSYLVVKPTNLTPSSFPPSLLRQDTSESEFRGLLTQQEGVLDVARLLPSSHTSPALLSFQSVEAAVHACILLHNQDLSGKLLYVTFSEATPGV